METEAKGLVDHQELNDEDDLCSLSRVGGPGSEERRNGLTQMRYENKHFTKADSGEL